MKRKEKLGIIALSIIVFLPMIPAYAESDSNKPPMTIDWKLKDAPEGESYFPIPDGEKILVYGTINSGYESTFEIGDIQTDVSLTLSDPVRERIGIEQAEPVCAYDQCYFEWTITVGGPLWKHTGQYEIQACYLGYNNPHAQCASTEIPYVKAPESYPESKSIESIITLEPDNNDRVKVHVKFIDVIGQIIKHVNYDITAKHNSVTVLEESGVHNHDGQGIHVTAPLDINPNSNDVVDVEVTFGGIGMNEPYGGPIGKVFQITESLNLSQKDSTDIIELQKENRLLKEENFQLQSQINQLQNKINNLNAIISEQISVIYEWILTK